MIWDIDDILIIIDNHVPKHILHSKMNISSGYANPPSQSEDSTTS